MRPTARDWNLETAGAETEAPHTRRMGVHLRRRDWRSMVKEEEEGGEGMMIKKRRSVLELRKLFDKRGRALSD